MPDRRGSKPLESTLSSPLARMVNMKLKKKFCTIVMCTVSLNLIALSAQPVSASYYPRNNYDPEQQDGIPVFSARSIAKLDDEWNGDMQESVGTRPIQRRQADNDLDDGLEEEDEDEYKSGSSPHESIESPSYGESQRFARDGDEIEDFFDKHLGPPKENDASSDESAEQPTTVLAQQPPPQTATAEVMVPAVDPDDHYEAAASGPLSSIFQTLLGGTHDHSGDNNNNKKKQTKRPFLQISTTTASDSEPATATATNDDTKSATNNKGAASSNTMKASQSAQSFVEASPITLALAPAAAPSTAPSLQEPGVEASSEMDPYGSLAGNQVAPDGGGGVREIYIGRRPTVMSYLQQQQQQQQQQQHHHHQQQVRQQRPVNSYTTAGSANVWRNPNGQQMLAYEQEQVNDYARNPLAASYIYQQQPSNLAQSSELSNAGAGDDEQTVTYGLSFGGSSAADEPAADSETAPDAPETPIEPSSSHHLSQAGYNPYSTRYTTSSTRAMNNYQSGYDRQPVAGYMRAYPIHPQQQQQMMRQHQHQHQQQMMPVYQQAAHYQQYQQQHQSPQQQQYVAGNGPTRYHRDPSESSTQYAAMRAAYALRGGANFDPSNQYDGHLQRGLGGDGQRPGATLDGGQLRERQKLLASLDREIKASPQYRASQAAAAATTGDATALRNSYLRGPSPAGGRQLVTYKELHRAFPNNDDELDTYTSYHSVTDPYKTQTTTSRMINDPLRFLLPRRQTLVNNGHNQEQNFYGNQDHASSSKHVANQSLGTLNYDPGANQQQANENNGQTDGVSNAQSNQQQQQQTNGNNLLTGPLINYDNAANAMNSQGDLLRNSNLLSAPNDEGHRPSDLNQAANQDQQQQQQQQQQQGHYRVRRDDSDEREIDNDQDDDGVWVDDDEDDDNRQQSSDLNETSQYPEEEGDDDGQQDDASSNNVLTPQQINPPGVIGGPHGYELSPNDLMIYHG